MAKTMSRTKKVKGGDTPVVSTLNNSQNQNINVMQDFTSKGQQKKKITRGGGGERGGNTNSNEVNTLKELQELKVLHRNRLQWNHNNPQNQNTMNTTNLDQLIKELIYKLDELNSRIDTVCKHNSQL